MVGLQPVFLSTQKFYIPRSIYARDLSLAGNILPLQRSCSAKEMNRRVLVPSGRMHWVFDWDGTLTKRDTLDALVNIAVRFKPSFPVLQEWKRVTQAYLVDYEETLKDYASDEKLLSTIIEEKNLLSILHHVEQRSIDRVSTSKIFAGLTRKALDDGAIEAVESGEVQVREDGRNFLSYLRDRVENQQPDLFSIISVNWSRRFIAACLQASNLGVDQSILEAIHANELEGIAQGRPSSGELCAGDDFKIISSGDKLARLERLHRPDKRTKSHVPVIYVGDSWTDFECLVVADLGICIRDNPMTSTQKKLADSLMRVGIRCPHLRNIGEAGDHSVVWVNNFHEIQSWAQKAQQTPTE